MLVHATDSVLTVAGVVVSDADGMECVFGVLLVDELDSFDILNISLSNRYKGRCKNL